MHVKIVVCPSPAFAFMLLTYFSSPQHCFCLHLLHLVPLLFGIVIPTSFYENVFTLINPRHACAGWVCVSVCVHVCVCLLSHISPLERLFILKILSRTERATKVKIFVGFSLKPLCCGNPALPPLHTVSHFSMDSTHAYYVYAHFNSACVFKDPSTRGTEGSALYCIHYTCFCIQ